MPKILVIDDSFFMRTLISDCLTSEPGMEVVTAPSGAEALKIIPKLKPDCITLDLVLGTTSLGTTSLPEEDGLTLLKAIMNRHPTPVIILSAHSQEGAEVTLQCLAEGAVGFVVKPSGELSLDIDKVKKQLIAEIKSALLVDRKRLLRFLEKRSGEPRRSIHEERATRVIILGASTGGPPVLEEIVSQLPADFPHIILVAQHMPTLFFTEQFAHRLDRNCHLSVKVAEDGEVLCGGRVYLVPSEFRTEFKQKAIIKKSAIHLTPEEPNGLTPSINAVMESAAHVWGERVTGVLLTGMGSDGLKGMEAIKKAGGKTIAQDESALIFGMPRVVIEAGLADEILPAEKIAERIILSQDNPGESSDEDQNDAKN